MEPLRETIHQHGELALTWEVLGVNRCVAMPSAPASASEAMPPLSALASQHIYAASEKATHQWVDAFPQLSLYLIAVKTGQRIGAISVELRRVVTNCIELQNLEVPLQGLDSGVLHIQASVGFTRGGPVSCEKRTLEPRMSGLVYVPPDSVVVPEPLTESWLALLSQKIT